MPVPDDAALRVFTAAADMRAFTRSQRAQGKTVALVPTMGNLHEGHIALVTAARQEADIVIASIYVNPTQFAKNEDFDRYPRHREEDRRMLRDAGCHTSFEPPSLYYSTLQKSESHAVVGVSEHVPGDHETFIQVEHLQRGLCGRSRPTFFRGVATVVAKLLHIVEPDVVLLGQKDYQQWRLLERMVRDLDFGTRVLGLPIVRHADGLAMSSRNNLLTEEDRRRAPCIYQALRWAAEAVGGGGEAPSAVQLCSEVERRIAAGGGRVDYVEVVDAAELRPVQGAVQQPVLIAVAAFFGSVRLIDNAVIEPPQRMADGQQQEPGG